MPAGPLGVDTGSSGPGRWSRMSALLGAIGVLAGCSATSSPELPSSAHGSGSAPLASSLHHVTASESRTELSAVTVAPTSSSQAIESVVASPPSTAVSLGRSAMHSCKLSRSIAAASSDRRALSLGPIDFESLRAVASVPKVSDVGVVVKHDGLSVIRKSPITASRFDGTVTVTLSAGAVYFAYPWDDSWTSGSRPLDLTPFLTKSMTFEGCPDASIMVLGGIVADRPDQCFVISARRGNASIGSERIRLDGQKCS